MSLLDEQLRQAIRHSTSLEDQVVPAKVLSVDLEAMTAKVAPIAAEDVPIYSVRLAATDAPAHGVICVPVVGSTVLVASIGTKWQAAYVAMVSEVEVVWIRGDQFGGLVKAPELKTQLDKTNAVVLALMQTLLTWAPVPGDGGAALKLAITSALAGKTLGTFVNLENTNVKHG